MKFKLPHIILVLCRCPENFPGILKGACGVGCIFNSNRYKWSLLLGILLLNYSCYKNVGGCLDKFSSNFAANADFECEDCCEYPNIQLGFSYSLGDSAFAFADTVFNELDSFKIVNAGLYLYDFSITNGNAPITNQEEAAFWFGSGNNLSQETLVTDFASISPSSGTSYILGTHNRREQCTQVNFSLGLPTEWNNLFKDTLADDSALNIDNNPLYNSQDGYAVAYMQIVYDFDTGDTVLYQLPITEWEHSIALDTSFLVNFGENISIPLKLDLLEWTKGIDFETNGSDIELIKEMFVINIPNSISLNN